MNSSNAAVSESPGFTAADGSARARNSQNSPSPRPTMTLVSSTIANSRTPISREEALRQAILRSG